MLIAIKTLLHTLLLPPGGPLLLATVGACLLAWRDATRRTRRTGWALLAVGLATLWLLAVPLVADALGRAAQRCPPLDLTRPVQAQAIVILGGEAQRLGAPEYGGEPAASLHLLERLNYGALVARRTGLPVTVSGSHKEALAMSASLARDFGIRTRWVEDRSRDTFQNAQFCAELLKPLGVTRIVLVTDADHEWRAMHEFVSAGFSVVPAPVGLWVPHGIDARSFLPNVSALAYSTAALYELLGDLARQGFEALHLRQHTR
ncbi:MAG TPA: YdcF family protein [Steroidobacteraceae bacterium]|jgi:uncharacterized SAM-binding protein YcdF (DUF218 family)|nr:YdcF family protein [Steroidobacteraceae bacterium]